MSKRGEHRILRVVVICLPLVLAAVAGFLVKFFFFPNLADPITVYDIVQTNQKWTREESQWYYHTSQGSQLMPWQWFVSLEQTRGQDKFIAPANLTRYRLMPDVNPLFNPYRLPVGFAIDEPDPVTGIRNIGISCAACHTLQINYRGLGLRIDGAPGMMNFDAFLEDLIKAVMVTDASREKFGRFAEAVLALEDSGAKSSDDLRSQVRAWIRTQAENLLEQINADADSGLKPTASGFGRIDALGQGGNTVYGKLTEKNLAVLDGPVNVLPLWYAHAYGWVQSNSSIRQPMGRNIIEALAVNASLSLPGTATDRYQSSVRMKNMYLMEELTAKLAAPEWPEWLFGDLDQARVSRGAALYKTLCARCHAPVLESDYDIANDPLWPKDCPQPVDPVSTANGKVFYQLRMFSVDYIGTDPRDAVNFAERRAYGAEQIGLTPDADGTVSGAAVVIPAVIDGIMSRRYNQELKLPEAEQEVWNGFRSSLWRACKAYPARPLAGTWATAPFLHNGSVPTLYQLLSPVAERDGTFNVGSLEYDPEHVGFETTKIKGAFTFKTSITGNSNAGHELRDAPEGTAGVIGRGLSEEERFDLIEFLKQLRFEDEVPKGQYPPAGWVWESKSDDYLYEGANAAYEPASRTAQDAATAPSPPDQDGAGADSQ